MIHESLDQTNLSNDVDWTSMAVGESLSKLADKWAQGRLVDLGVGSAELAQCQVGPSFGGLPSRVF
jgi:hypothetical protein